MEQIWLRRVARELAAHRSRTALTVLSIAVGLFAVSLTFRTQAILTQNVLDSYADAVPAAIVVEVAPADPDVADSLRRVPGVAAVEAVRSLSTRVLADGVWRPLAITGVGDVGGMQVNRLARDAGAWPPPDRELLVERSYAARVGAPIGGVLLVELEDGTRRRIAVAGTVQDRTVISGRLGSPVLQAYATLDTVEWLTGRREVSTFLIAVADGPYDAARVRAVADRVRAKLENGGHSVKSVLVRDPGAPDFQPIVAAVFQTLTVLGSLSLVLSAALVVNTISAMLTRHVPQIGVMKALGARRRDIFRTYVTMVLLFALLALLAAVPLGALCAWQLANQLAWLLNYDIRDGSVPAGVVALELAAGLLVPLLASLVPVGAAAGVTVREAIGGMRASSLRDGTAGALSAAVRGVPIGLLYAARSMFRRKARLALTLAALTFAGAIQITVISAQASLYTTLDQVARYWQQDLTVSFNVPERAARAAQEARQVPGVVGVEQQPYALAVRRRPDGRDSDDRYAIYGVVPRTALLAPTLVQGRWLRPDDADAMVVNVDFLKREPDLRLGDRVTLSYGGRTTSWRIVGVTTSHLLIYGTSTPGQGSAYISDAPFAEVMTRSATTNRIIVTTARHDAAFRDEVASAIEARFARAGIQALVQTQTDIRDQITRFVSLLLLLLLVMALIFVAVGALSLVGAMSLNVLERTKEVGILRAIGSTHSHVASVVIAEGVCVGVLSWLPATLLAVPMSKLLSDILGWSVLSWPLIHVFPLAAPLLWLVAVTLLSAAASYVPARHAASINVRTALEHL